MKSYGNLFSSKNKENVKENCGLLRFCEIYRGKEELSCRVFDWRPRGHRFVSLSKTHLSLHSTCLTQ